MFAKPMMLLIETERLVRRISDLLNQVGNPAIAPKLAEDFVAACQAANLRLQQCEAMIKAGDRHQAIQLAETTPNLLDVVTVLEFRGSDDWRAYCQQHGLPVADRIDARSVQALNNCYAQGISTDHPLYAVYRRAVLTRNDDEALKALQSITRLNPSDGNAASELARLDVKVLGTKLQHLGDSLDGADPASLVAEIESIEVFGFKARPDGEVWRKALAIRCAFLLEEAARLKDSSQWMEALARIDFVHRLQDEFKLEFPAAISKRLNDLDAWARGEQEKDRKEREFKSLLAELQYRIQQSEEKDTSARYVKLPELRDDFEGLHKVWRSLTDFTRPIPEDAGSRFRKRSELLENEIARRSAIRRKVIVATSAVVLMIGTLAVWLVLGHMKTESVARQLQEAVSQRQVHAAEKLLERVHAEKDLARAANVGAASTAAESFVAKEHALLGNFETSFGKLPRQFAGEPDAGHLAATADQFVTVRGDLNALAPELKAENEPRVQAVEKQWQNFLSTSSASINGVFDQWLSSAESQSRDLDYRSPLDHTTNQMASLGTLVRKINDLENGFTNHLNLRSDLLQRYAVVRSKFAAYGSELQKVDDGMGLIRKARTAKEFSAGARLAASSEFSGAPVTVAASAIQTLNVDETATLRLLLGLTNAGTWAYVNSRTGHLFPEMAMPAEQQIFRQLSTDPAISANHQHYRFWLDSAGTKSVEWITVGPLDPTTGWKKITACTQLAGMTSVDFDNRDYGYFDGQYKLSRTEPVSRVESLGPLNETASFHTAGIQKVWPGGDAYAKGLMETLDAIKDSHEGSPIFRAYLFLRLADVMKLQPDSWGLSFCPAINAHAAQIRNIFGGPPISGDWFLAAKANAYNPKVEQFFASVKAVSYAKQAGGVLALERGVCKNGVRYAGFVGLDHKLNFIDEPAPAEVWGYGAARTPILLEASGQGSKPHAEQAMALSPLFALDGPRKEYLAKADVNPADASFQGVLPPLFAQSILP
jgi:hypothetical protein